jgi:hypothetical protein
MAQTTILTLIPHTTYPGTSGSVQSITGDQFEAASYYLSNRDLQTISWSVENDFDGAIEIQASLVAVPESTDWFDVYSINTSSTKNGFYNLHGNFVWLRAVITDWTIGDLNLVSASY